MAASGFTPISLYYSTTAAAEPTAGNLVSGELAINIADGKLFYKNSSGNVRLLSIGYGSSTVTPTNGGVQYGTGSALALTAAGSSGQILRSNGAAAPTWADLSSLGVNTISFGSTGLTPSTATSGAVTVAGTLITSNGGTGLSSYTLGDMVYYSAGTTLTKLTIGAANRVMTSSGSAPQWVDSLTGLSSVSSTAFTENSYPVVSQSDIGTAPNEIPLNQYLGSMAYQDADNYLAVPQATGWGFKNRIINGGMVIDQRNAGASVTQGTSLSYVTDRFAVVGSVASKFTAQQSTTAPTGFINSFLCTSSSAYTVGASEDFSLRHYVEGLNIPDLAWGSASAKTITLSFWVRSSLTGTFGGVIANSAQDRFYVFSYTISAANTWEQKSITIPGDTSGTWLTTNGIGIRLFWSLGAGATVSSAAGSWGSTLYRNVTGGTSVVGTNGATFYITGVQLEVGTQATAFDWRPYGTELMLCQRYYEKTYNIETAPGTNTTVGSMNHSASSEGNGNFITDINFKVTKRAAPTLTAYQNGGTSGSWAYEKSGSSGTNTVTFDLAGQSHVRAYVSVGSNWTICYVYGHWTASAEL